MNGAKEDSGDCKFCAVGIVEGEIVIRPKPSRMLPTPSRNWLVDSSHVLWKSKKQFVMRPILEATECASDIVSSDSSPADIQREKSA